MKKVAVLFMSLWIGASGVSYASSDISDAARSIPIQHNGRIKPLDSFSRQAVELITGKETFERKPAIKWMLESLIHPESIASRQWVRIDYIELVKTLGLEANKRYFSYEEIRPSFDKIKALVQSAKEKRNADIRPTKLEQKAEQLFTKIITVDELTNGDLFTMIPDPKSGEWRSLDSADPEMASKFKNLLKLYSENNITSFTSAVQSWDQEVYSISKLASQKKVDLEVLYYRIRPFELAAVFYFLAFLILTLYTKNKSLKNTGHVSLGLAILFHTLGILLRVIILSRPPVSNMYESMVFMNWALIVFACIFALTQKNTFILTAASVISGFVMIYGNLLPIDSSLEVLVPVLRSNYWLSIHVMTIVSSYGAFGLAMALGHRHLFKALGGKFKKKQSEESARAIYRVIQLGTLLIGAGTVLGGVWANESWGRFWGWDPKETWALITFLGYLIVVHLRHMNKLSDFALATSAVLGFLLVLMTWYGVNFVLGRGLHSYGQGSGGIVWIVVYLIFEALFLAYISFFKRKPA